MNNLIKYIFLLSITFFLQTSVFGQSKVVLGEEEIRKSPYTKFENRSDKYATPERKAMEVEIGKGLHDLVITTDKPVNFKGFTLQRFYSDETGKLGGDILVLNKNSNYGHINSIKRILNSYIQNSFEYTEKNADLVVMEVLYYNAQNRMKLDRIKKRYTKSLIAALNKKKVGIGKKFSEWPGNTQIIIPIKSPANYSPEVVNKDNSEPTNTNEKSTVTEKEKIKVTKVKIPSSEMPKENITNSKNPSNDSDLNIIKEEKKIIEKKEKDSDSQDTNSITEEDMKQPGKNNPPTKSTDSNTEKDQSKIADSESTNGSKTENSKETSKDSPEIKSAKATTQDPKTNNAQNTDSKVSKNNEPAKELGKDKNNNPKLAKDEKEILKKEEKIIEVLDKKSETETNKDLTPENKTVSTKEPKAEESKKDTSKTVAVNDTKPTIAKDTNETSKKEVKKEELDKKSNAEKGKDGNVETKTVSVKDSKTEESKKDTSKTVAVNESKSSNAKETITEKPAVKEVKNAEQPKKESPSTTEKKTVDKIPTTKTEIKKMHKELIELKAKEKDKVENSDNVVGEKIVFLKVKEFLAEGHYTSEMWAVDTENDDELFQSPFKKVCGKEFKELETGVVVMSFKDNDMLKTDTHHLALIDKESLKLIKQTPEVIFWRSFLKEQSGKIYAVEIKDGKYYLAQFKSDLTFEMRSSDPINPDCEIAFKKNKIYLTKRSNDNSEVSIRVLNRDNLKLRDVKVMK